ncbi:C39 family peptidase [Bacillus canaveralius]|uniref:C39 family peptidase n=1 Tax=Bacillus canaveralius TaxID=1403243 RepID=UPI001FE2C1A7|nr:C39 family peptidase [Bacillus canaveralius]
MDRTKITILLLVVIIVSLSFYLFTILKKEGGISNVLNLMLEESGPEIVEASSFHNENDKSPIVKIKQSVLLNAPVIKQFPELPRGCEVTSLAMLLQYAGINVDKMELAQKVKKNPAPLTRDRDKIFWGDPNDGYIGDMYSYSNPGFAVYHTPIKDLAEQFLPGRIVDLTGKDFIELKTFLSLDIPVWVITNTTYKILPENAFEKWQTPNGEVKITYKEHSVLITGYDEKYVYFNDPISGTKNMAITTTDFLDAWRQMGSQAVSYLPKIIE